MQTRIIDMTAEELITLDTEKLQSFYAKAFKYLHYNSRIKKITEESKKDFQEVRRKILTKYRENGIGMKNANYWKGEFDVFKKSKTGKFVKCGIRINIFKCEIGKEKFHINQMMIKFLKKNKKLVNFEFYDMLNFDRKKLSLTSCNSKEGGGVDNSLPHLR